MTPADHIESLLHIATARGYEHRQPNRYPRQPHDQDIGFHLHQLDRLGTRWRIQNAALMFYNEADTSRVWNCLFRNSIPELARRICGGSTFNELTEERTA